MSSKLTYVIWIIGFVHAVQADIAVYDSNNTSANNEIPTTYLAREVDGTLVYGNYANNGQDNVDNRIPDWSRCGYQGGGVPIPFIPTVLTLEPSGSDDTDAIQDAIKQVGNMPLDENGFRGALLLKAGTYFVSSMLELNRNGVVLRGEGSDEVGGTKILFTADTQINAMRVGISKYGENNVSGTSTTVTDSYVPTGATSFNVSDSSVLSVGDKIRISRAMNQQWLEDINMDVVWKDLSYPFGLTTRRVITNIEGNTIFVDVPLVQPINSFYDTTRVSKYNITRSARNIGLEGIRFESIYNPDDEFDEDHGNIAVTVRGCYNFWVRQVTAQHFVDGGVIVYSSMYGTVEDCATLDPKSQLAGGRRDCFGTESSQYILFQRNYSRGGRHDYKANSREPGPNAYVDGRADQTFAESGPHQKWSVGHLFDNIKEYRVSVRNRGYLGGDHGWTGAQMMMWNNNIKNVQIVDAPVSAMNFSVGCVGPVGNGSFGGKPSPPGIWESVGAHVTPRSLYYAQLEDRLGWNAVQNVIIPQQAKGPIWNELHFWGGDGLFGDPVVIWERENSDSETADLLGVVRDLTMLENGVNVTWSKLSGPGEVFFTTPNALETQATFSEVGTYELQLVVNDGSKLVSNTITVGEGSTQQSIQNLISHFTFDTDANDSLSSRYGLLENGASLVGSAKVGSGALMLDGEDDHVALSKINFGNNFSISAWVNILDSQNDMQTILANSASGESKDGFKFSINKRQTTDGSVVIETGNGSASNSSESIVEAAMPSHFHHITATIDRTAGTANIYVNGIDITLDNTIRTDFSIDTSLLHIGQMTNGRYRFGGVIDDLGIFSTTLSAVEARAIFELADSATLNYDVGKATKLLNHYFYSRAGSINILGREWHVVKGLSGEQGDLIEKDGDFTIRLDVAGGLSTVRDDSLNPAAIWRLEWFGTTENTGDAADYTDPDNDGIVNFVEYGFGTNPTENQGVLGQPVLFHEDHKLKFKHRKRSNDASLTYTIQTTDDLNGEWTDVPLEQESSITLDDEFEELVFDLTDYIDSGYSKFFIRIILNRTSS